MPGGVRFRYSVTPRLLRVVAAHEYTGIFMEHTAGDVSFLHVKRYRGSAFAEILGVLDGAGEGIGIGTRQSVAASITSIPEDSAGLVGDHSIAWCAETRVMVYDPSVPAVFELLNPAETVISPPIYLDGWLYYLAARGDLATMRLRRTRCNLTAGSAVGDTIDDPDSGVVSPFCQLTADAMYCRRTDVVLRFALAGGTPESNALPGATPEPDAPFRCGLPLAGDTAYFLLTSGSDVAAYRFTGPTTETPLWPASWATWADPNGSDPVLSHSLSPDASEVAIYKAKGGLLRVPVDAQSDPSPAAITVGAHAGQIPDFMLARD